MDILTVLKIIGLVLQLIASGLSESQAVEKASAMVGVSESFIRKIIYDIFVANNSMVQYGTKIISIIQLLKQRIIKTDGGT